MHTAFESLKSYAEYKGWKWSDDLTMLALDVAEDWDNPALEGRWYPQWKGFEEVFAALLFHNQVWHGFRVFNIHYRLWPIFVNGKPVSHYHIHRNRHQLMEVVL